MARDPPQAFRVLRARSADSFLRGASWKAMAIARSPTLTSNLICCNLQGETTATTMAPRAAATLVLILAAAALAAAQAPVTSAPACAWDGIKRVCDVSAALALTNVTARPGPNDTIAAAVLQAWAQEARCNAALTADECAANPQCTFVPKSVRCCLAVSL